MRRTAGACVAVVLASVAVAGCTPASGEPRPAGASAAADQAWEPTTEDEILLLEAEQLLVKECMEQHGYEYWVWALPTPDELEGGGYMITDVEWAERNGYGGRLSDRLIELQRDDPNHSYANGLPDDEGRRYSETLYGPVGSRKLTASIPGGGAVQVSAEGCEADAKDRLYGDLEAWFPAEKVATNLTGVYVPDLLADPRFVRARAEWSACMNEAGYDYPDPPSIREDLPRLTRGADGDEAFEIERELAVAEATCATETSFSETARALDGEYRAELRDEYGEELATYQRMSAAALIEAEQVAASLNG